MSDDSPLFVSAIELLAHSTESFTEGNTRRYKFKFIILHLANAIELILKDRLIDAGVSIYVQRQSRTIDIWTCFTELQKVGVIVPERPLIELLVDDRNTIQHRFGFPDSDTAYYYLRHVVAFFARFLDQEYGVDLAATLKTYLSNEDIKLIGLAHEDEYSQLDRLYELSPESAVLQAYNSVETKIQDVLGLDAPARRQPYPFWRDSRFSAILDGLAQTGFISSGTASNFGLFRDLRNQAAHTAHFVGKPAPDWSDALRVGKDLLQGLDRAAAEGFFLRWTSQTNTDDTESYPVTLAEETPEDGWKTQLQ